MKTTEKYTPLFDKLVLPNGQELENRFVLSPMITNSSTSEGYVTEEDLAYARRRASSAPLQITGAAYIEKFGQLFEYGFSIDDDRSIEGLTKLATAMKKDGAKAVVQLTHAGRFAKIGLRDFGAVYGPSKMELKSPFEHTVLTMSKRKIKNVITQYADATRRAIQAGFDGVEVSSAQRLLIQTFFSTFSNQREDEYGPQSLENRARFGVEVMEAVQKVIDEEAPKDFILGFRGTPEETRGNEVGYSVEDFLYFMDRIMEVSNIEYLATASWGKNIYKQTIRQGKYKGELMNKVVHDYMKGRVPVMATGGINTPEKALEAITFSDFVGLSSPFVTEPDFVTKLKEGREEEIDLGFTPEELADLAIPERAFKDIVELMDIGGSLSEEAREELRKLYK
jgi:2,4-dienoyl-CoA reductase-like NADH-dependent reductase (Old Yellow Enzyme family)